MQHLLNRKTKKLINSCVRVYLENKMACWTDWIKEQVFLKCAIYVIGDTLKRHIFRELFIKARGLRLKNSWPLSKIMFHAKFISGFHGLYVVIQQTLVLYRVEHEQTLFLRLCCQGVLHLISRKFKPKKEEGCTTECSQAIKKSGSSHHRTHYEPSYKWVTVECTTTGKCLECCVQTLLQNATTTTS